MAQVVDLLNPSPLMAALMPQLISMRVAFEGGMQFKRAVLLKKASESPALYQDKINNLAAAPICKSMIGEIMDIIYDQEPARTIAFLNGANQPITGTPAWFEDFLENADLQNTDFTAFMENAATTAAVEGWSWIFCDLPETQNKNNRPYLTLIPAQHVIDWDTFTENGVTIITYLKVIEYVDDETKRVKVWERGTPGGIDDETGDAIPETPTTATCYEIPMAGGVAKVSVVEPSEVFTFPSTYPIPVVQVMPVRDIQKSVIGVSDLTDIADMQREWLRLEAEAYDSIRFSKPIVRVDNGLKVPAGGGGIVHGPKDCMEVWEIPVMDVEQIRKQQIQLIATFDGFTGRAGTRNVAEQVQSGISIVEERKTLHKKAQTRARQLEKVEETVINLVAFMMGLVWVGDIEYNSDYESRDTQYKMALLTSAKGLTQNPIIQNIIDIELIKMIAPVDELTKYLQMIGVSKIDVPRDVQVKDDDYRETGTAQDGGESPLTVDPLVKQI